MGNVTKALVAVGLVTFVVAAACGPVGKETDCRNGVDDDKNGATDCLDPSCVTDQACVGGDAGIDYTPCTTQANCVDAGWAIDRPLRACLGQRCAAQGPGVVAVQIEASTDAFFGSQVQFKAMSTRLIKKFALDNSTVTCMTIRAAAPGRTAADADQLEKAGKFNNMGYDVIRVESLTPGQRVTNNLMYTAVGSDFIIYNELWSGFPTSDANARQPTGTRVGYSCVESGNLVQPIGAADSCVAGSGGTCRSMLVTTVKE